MRVQIPAGCSVQRALGAFRKELAARSPEFDLISDVAETHKHMKLNKPVRAVTSAGQAFIEPVFTQAKRAVKKQTVIVKRTTALSRT
jgi:hypothetical protein